MIKNYFLKKKNNKNNQYKIKINKHMKIKKKFQIQKKILTLQINLKYNIKKIIIQSVKKLKIYPKMMQINY